MAIKNQIPNYAITAGDHAFTAEQVLEGDCAVIQAQYSGIVATDVRLQLEQSIGGVQFDPVPGSVQTLDPTKPSHSWNWPLAPEGIFVRVAVKNCAGKAGSITKIDFLI